MVGGKVNQFTAARSWHSDPGLRQALTVVRHFFKQHKYLEIAENVVAFFNNVLFARIKRQKVYTAVYSVHVDPLFRDVDPLVDGAVRVRA